MADEYKPSADRLREIASTVTTGPKTFPVLNCDFPGRTLRAVPWGMLEPHRTQANTNHHQTLEGLACRGGLDPTEMLAILEDRKWHGMDVITAENRIVQLVREYLSK